MTDKNPSNSPASSQPAASSSQPDPAGEMPSTRASGRKMKPRNSAGRDLKVAIPVGIGLGALVLTCVFLIPGWYPLVAAAMGLATWEVTTRLKEAGYVLPRWLMIAGGQAMVWSSMWYETKGVVSAFVATCLAVMFLRLFARSSTGAPENYLRDMTMSIFVLTWIPLFGSFAAMLGRYERVTDSGAIISGSSFIVTLMLCVIASDVGGYAAGVVFGKHPMAPAVSPKKSWEGFAGSVITAALAGAGCVHFLLQHSFLLGLLMGMVLAVCATMGDLVESQFKRELGIKDMSAMVPGHGGIMDRLDGMLPAAMITWLVLSFI